MMYVIGLYFFLSSKNTCVVKTEKEKVNKSFVHRK